MRFVVNKMVLNDKNGQGRVTWVIVVMLIAVVVTIVILNFSSEGMDKGEKGLFSCQGKGGSCEVSIEGKDCAYTCDEANLIVSPMLQCPDENDKERCCCVKKD